MYRNFHRAPALLLAFLLAFLPLFSFFSCAPGEKTGVPAAESRETPTDAGLTPDQSAVVSPDQSAASSPDSAETPPPDDVFTLSEEEARELNDSIFLQFGISYPRFQPGKEGEAYFFGRWFEKEIDGASCRVTTTDGSRFYFLCENCPEITLDFLVITSRETPYYAFSVDGSEPQRRRITDGKIELPDEERHLVTVVADGMTESENKWVGEIGFALREIVLPEGGRIRQAVPQNKVIAFYGDSITEGIAALGGSYTAHRNSASAAYPRFCAEELNALPYYVGYGGSGVTVQGSFNVFQRAIDCLGAERKVDAEFNPDLIVINHGHNDLSSASGAFKTALKRALALLQSKYPGVPVVYMVPFNGSHREDIKTVCAEFENVTVVDTDGWKISFTDGIHPSKAGAKSVGKQLADALTEIFGNEFFA